MNLDDMRTFGVEVEFLSNFSRNEVSRQINAATGIPIYLILLKYILNIIIGINT